MLEELCSQIKYSPSPFLDWAGSGHDGISYKTDRDGNPNVFKLERNDDGLWLNENWASPDNRWNPDNEFIFVLPSKSLYFSLKYIEGVFVLIYSMANNFWQKLNRPFTVLASMANVTDWAFRQIIIETGRPDVFYTEFISCDGICAVGPEKFKGELYFEENERPIVVQFFTSNPEHMKRCAELAVEMGFDGIDINMGCPDKSVEKQGAGAALIKDPKLAQRIIKAAKEGAGSLPVSVKTRLGHSKIEIDTWIPSLLETGIAALIVHGRTRKEMSAVPAHWDEIGKVTQMAKGSDTLIVGNGDVKDMNELRQKANDYSLDGIMVGRGIFTNPWFFSENVEYAERTPIERINLLIKHLNNFEKLWGSNKNFDTMKRFFKIYINGWPACAGRPGAKDLRTKLMESKNLGEAIKIGENYLRTQ